MQLLNLAGFQVNNWWGGGSGEYFHLNVKFPLPEDDFESPLFFNHIRTDLPLFIHRVGNLQQSAHFRSVEFASLSAPITVEVGPPPMMD